MEQRSVLPGYTEMQSHSLLAEHESQAPNSFKSSQGLQQNLGEPKRV